MLGVKGAQDTLDTVWTEPYSAVSQYEQRAANPCVF